MTHYMVLNGKRFPVDMGCTHPDMVGNTTESVHCDGNCAECPWGKATMSISDFLAISEKADLRLVK